MIRRITLLGLFLSISVPSYGGDVQWLGYYKGADIPGHEIVESEMVLSTFFGPQQDGAYQEVLDVMKGLCLIKKGMALVNVDMTPAIGEVRMPSANAGQAKIASQGLHVRGVADCVLKMK